MVLRNNNLLAVAGFRVGHRFAFSPKNELVYKTAVGSIPPSKTTTMAVTQDTSYDDSDTRVWLITGTSSGMGRALVKSALDRNDKVIATARVLEQIQDLRSFADKSRLYLMQLDITDSQDVINSKVTEAIAVWGRIDVLVNNAGTGVKMILEEGGYVSVYPLTHFLR